MGRCRGSGGRILTYRASAREADPAAAAVLSDGWEGETRRSFTIYYYYYRRRESRRRNVMDAHNITSSVTGNSLGHVSWNQSRGRPTFFVRPRRSSRPPFIHPAGFRCPRACRRNRRPKKVKIETTNYGRFTFERRS